ncbi:MAG: DNA-directed RNA polymerase subunit F [Candidatus Diapherotrites archaeon]|uniref:DNA-directed RNA polymerase subunit Rpo4 n=1 Tax=Candidatus Iainarchaeum sp. TaxID=3101447 RepID=A0A2D6LPR0_9ARCH|nr:DNA-directed RNA polymerase subunit F [Candidatus Diapherotrites archaeon]|tara:strand:+ start:253 stop:591 length:339 start_codon:yes stop_codon:yes gene_type:complete
MIGKKIVSQENLSLFELKQVLSERNKEGELSYEQQAAFDYSKKFAKVSPSKGEKLLKDLKAIEGLDDDFITKAIDILPTDLDTAKLIAYRTNPNLDDEKLKKVVELTSKHAK